MNDSIIAHRYAVALSGFALSNSVEEAVFHDSELIRSQLTGSKTGMKFINSPNIKLSAKKLFIKNIFGNHIDAITLRFLDFVLEQQRQNLLDDIFRIFQDIYRKKNNIFKVRVTAAVEMSTDRQESFKKLLGKKLGGEVDMRFDVDSSLIGGSLVRIGDRLLDTSIKTQLKKIEKILSE